MSIKKIFSFATSIISLLVFICLTTNSSADNTNSKRFSNDKGILSIMYHRFNESKYPSTNIQMDIFQKHIQIIKESGFNFYYPEEFKENFNLPKSEKKILITIYFFNKYLVKTKKNTYHNR